jgi:hypothetical protein
MSTRNETKLRFLRFHRMRLSLNDGDRFVEPIVDILCFGSPSHPGNRRVEVPQGSVRIGAESVVHSYRFINGFAHNFCALSKTFFVPTNVESGCRSEVTVNPQKL